VDAPDRILKAAVRAFECIDANTRPATRLVTGPRLATVSGPSASAELITALQAAARYYTGQLPRSWVPRYLAERGLDQGALARWGIGYAPPAWTALTGHLRGLGFSDQVLEQAGLAKRSRRGTLYDVFRDRVMFLVRTRTGRSPASPAADAPLPLPAICAAALCQHAATQDQWKQAARQAWQETGLVITTRYGTVYEPRNFNRHYEARCRKAGVRYIKPHGTRRTCGSLLAALDVHPRVAMRILRHSKIAVTMEIYTEVPDDTTRDALRRLGDTLNGQEPDDEPG
jgi:hypothetical protein